MAMPASRIADLCVHGQVVCSGSPDTIISAMLAARLNDMVTPCPLCLLPPGKIVAGSSTVFTNSLPQARIGDAVACGAPTAPPGGGSHAPVTVYGCKPEDNYVDAIFRDDAYLISEEPDEGKKPPPADKPPKREPLSFLDGLSLDVDLGKASGSGGGGGGANMLALGAPTVIVGG